MKREGIRGLARELVGATLLYHPRAMRRHENRELMSDPTRRLRRLARLRVARGGGAIAAATLILGAIFVMAGASMFTNRLEFYLIYFIVIGPFWWVLERRYKSMLLVEIECVLETQSPARFSDILVRLGSAAPKPNYLRRVLDEMARHGAIRNTEEGYVRGSGDVE